MKVFSEFRSCGNNIVLTQTAGARFSGPGSETVAVVEGESATLVCGTGLSGNPLPTLTWTDNNGRWGAVDKRDAIPFLFTSIVYVNLSKLPRQTFIHKRAKVGKHEETCCFRVLTTLSYL